MNLDSLLKRLPLTTEDSARILLYISIGQQYENNQPDTAEVYYHAALSLSRRISYPLGEIKSITNLTYILNMKGYYDSALVLNRHSVELSRQIPDSLYLGKTLFNTGTTLRQMSEFEEAVRCFEEGKVVFARFGNEVIEARTDDVLQLLYMQLHQYGKAIAYGEAAVALARKLDDPNQLGLSANNLGLSYIATGQFDRAMRLYQETLKIAKETGDKVMEHSQYLNFSDIAIQQGRYNDVKDYAEKALALTRELGLHESEAIALKAMSFYYTYRMNYPLARKYVTDALAITLKYDLRIERQKIYTQLSNIAYATQNMPAGEKYARLSTELADSLMNETLTKNSQELEKKYETEKKNGEIKDLKNEKQLQQFAIRKKNMLNAALVAGALGFGLLALLGYRNYKQKQRLQQQRIEELETEKQLEAAEAVLKGEGLERTRIARDLHDGLGGMLSGIRYSLNNIKGNLLMTADNAQHFERSIDMLDSSIQEMRRVAHNMMPENLVKFGLDTALRDFCNDINQSGALQVTYQGIGVEGAVKDQTAAITIYRIVQELINNAVKHAGARQAIVQLARTGPVLSVTVEDDGKGFDQYMTRPAVGMGWRNIRSRVEFLKGKLDVNTAPGKGTSVFIEFVTA